MSTIFPAEIRSGQGGFTLLEALVALLLVAILAGALYGTYFALSRGRDSAVADMERLRDARTTLDLLRREISSAFYNRNNRLLHFVVEDRDVFGKPASALEFTTLAAPLSGSIPSSDVVRVAYRIVEKNGNMLLTREDRDVHLAGAPAPSPLMEEVRGFLVECHDGTSWVRTWNTSLNNGLPRAVRITLTMGDGNGKLTFTAITVPRMRTP